MPLYGKFINENEIEYAQQNYNNIINFNKSVELMEEYGFKPVEDTPRPTIDESYQKVSWKWVDGETIVKNWTITEYRSKEEAEREHINSLTCTKRVFALMLQKLGIDYLTQLKPLIESNPQAALEWELCVELLRSNPLLDQMCLGLGVTPEQLDKLFLFANGELSETDLIIPKKEEELDEADTIISGENEEDIQEI